MIVGKLSDVRQQVAPSEGLAKGLAFLAEADGSALEDGRIEIDGDSVFALVQSYVTKDAPEVWFEGHRRYIDLQYVVSGSEALGWVPAELAEVTRPYSEERDMWLGAVAEDLRTMVRLDAGQVAVFYPSDAHAPQRAITAPEPVKKIVVKVAVGS